MDLRVGERVVPLPERDQRGTVVDVLPDGTVRVVWDRDGVEVRTPAEVSRPCA